MLQVGEELDEWLLVPLTGQQIACNVANVTAVGCRADNQIAVRPLGLLFGAKFRLTDKVV